MMITKKSEMLSGKDEQRLIEKFLENKNKLLRDIEELKINIFNFSNLSDNLSGVSFKKKLEELVKLSSTLSNGSRIYIEKEFPQNSCIESIVRLNHKERAEYLDSLVGECGFSKEIEFLTGLSNYERIILLDFIKEYIFEKKVRGS